MSGNPLLDGTALAVSLFNMILLLWLGLTVLLNVERRVLGAWLLGGGLLLGAAFFTSHTAILGHAQEANTSLGGLLVMSQRVNFWWQIGWVPVIASPFAWYGLILWYVGFWRDTTNTLRRRHRLWLPVMSVAALLLLGLALFTRALPSFVQIAQLDPSSVTALPTGVPAEPTSRADGHMIPVLAVYPFFLLLCILLSIDALRHPAPSPRLMGDLARARTRPWLMAAAVTLLVVSLLVTGFMVWTAYGPHLQSTLRLTPEMIFTTTWFDLLIEILIALTILLIGQAIVSYEVFTGRSLPRRGFMRHWRNAILLAAGYSVLVGASLALGLRTMYSLLLTTALMIVFYALFSWRSFVHRERFMAQLRPFVGSRRHTQHLVNTSAADGLGRPADAYQVDEEIEGRIEGTDMANVTLAAPPYQSQAQAIFHAVCVDVLGVERAQLIAMGALAPLAGPPLVYSAHEPDRVALASYTPSTIAPLNGAAWAPDMLLMPLAPDEYAGFHWAIPLWAARGMIGVILVDNPRDGGLFAQEEIERAQASGERIVDMLAGEELTRRLIALQRRRLAETHVLDHQTRRTLHDQVLPDLHAAILQVSSLGPPSPESKNAIASLTQIHHQIADLIRVSPGSLLSKRQPEAFLDDLYRMASREFSGEFQRIDWHGPDTAPVLDPLVAEVVFFSVREVIRNAAVHGRGDNPKQSLNLTIQICCDNHARRANGAQPANMTIVIQDDGVGPAHIDLDPLVQKQGGLALHSTMLAVVGGTLTISALSSGGAQVRITAPVRG